MTAVSPIATSAMVSASSSGGLPTVADRLVQRLHGLAADDRHPAACEAGALKEDERQRGEGDEQHPAAAEQHRPVRLHRAELA